ncbi:MAG: type II toxin-antitoxin system death-on-curing family toxin [Phycisphaerae bacterium]|jgi:death-on-curing family protein
MTPLTVKEVEYMAFRLAQEFLRFDEPIPDFTTRFPNILESSLFTPFQKFSRKYLYKTLVAKAAMLFYLMIKNHPFQNGNKRIAITTLLIFLIKTDRWIDVNIQEFYNFTVWVAQSPAKEKQYVLYAIEGFFDKHLTYVNIAKHIKKFR